MTLSGISETPVWATRLEELLPRYGHRNWIVVADSAYPSQSRAGIETILTGSTQEAVVEHVLTRIRKTPHVRPVIHVDTELGFVRDHEAPGAGAYRTWLTKILEGLSIQSLKHEEIIASLDHAAQTFSILILKTTMTIPYTSVFFQLDCAYWDAAAESRLRAAMST